MRSLEARRLGTVPYAEALRMQRALVEERKADRVPDLLLVLEHPPVITVGVKGDGGRSHVLASDGRLAELGIEIHETGRGGDVTYHGPGQLVGYPILDLKPDRCDVHRYVRDLEEVMIRVCADYGLLAGRVAGLTGTWVDDRRAGLAVQTRQDLSPGAEKIGAIGVRISRWITSHGFAFNVSTNLGHFELIVPCGIGDRRVTSLEKATGRRIAMTDAQDACIRHFADVFERDVVVAAEATGG